jgi:hypothetical protein
LRPVRKIEADMRAIQKRADTLSPDSPDMLELDAEYSALLEELVRAKQRASRGRNRFERLAEATSD